MTFSFKLAHPISRILFLLCLSAFPAFASLTPDAATIVGKMEEAYGKIHDYRMNVEVRSYGEGDGVIKTEKFLYTMKKPKMIRLDFVSSHSGMIVVFPDENGKAVVQPSGLVRFLKLHLSTDSVLLRTPSGQRLDQTDMGTLIGNISHSLTDRRRGEVTVSLDEGRFVLRVLADDHFQKGVITSYEFLIDPTRWLPVGIREATPDGRLKRIVTFDDMRINPGVSDSFFRLD